MNNPSPPQSVTLWRPKDQPYLEVIEGHSSQSYTGHLHLHEDLEIAWKPQGLWHMVIRGTTYPITTEQVVLTLPEEPHFAISLQGENGLSSYMGLRFQMPFLSAFVAEISVSAKAHLFASSSSVIEDPILTISFTHSIGVSSGTA